MSVKWIWLSVQNVARQSKSEADGYQLTYEFAHKAHNFGIKLLHKRAYILCGFACTDLHGSLFLSIS